MGDRQGAVEMLVTPFKLPDPAFWRDKRVLLTGHTGFKGAWAALWLARMGAEVTGFALPPATEPSLYDLAGVEADLVSIIGDLRDLAVVEAAVTKADPEIVLHLAAQPIVKAAIADPIDTLTTNVMGTANLLQALRAAPSLASVLVVTTDKVYSNSGDGHAYVEDDRLGGKDPYSASKAAAELVTASFAASYFAQRGIRVATARGGNVIGGGDFAADRIVTDIVRSVMHDTDLVLRMPEATRPWQHVLDCLAGYLLFAERHALGEDLPPALNFGPAPSRAITVGDLASQLLAALGRQVDFDIRRERQSVEMTQLAIDASLARARLAWQDRVVGDDLINWTADWYGKVLGGEPARATTLGQIDAYCGDSAALSAISLVRSSQGSPHS
jgi:CDP-glucose 4,6-dehydratase